jgi:hypothetical protein
LDELVKDACQTKLRLRSEFPPEELGMCESCWFGTMAIDHLLYNLLYEYKQDTIRPEYCYKDTPNRLLGMTEKSSLTASVAN